MRRHLTGYTAEVTATPQRLTLNSANENGYTLRNTGSNSIAYKHEFTSEVAVFVGADAAAFRVLGAGILRAGEQVFLHEAEKWLDLACYTGQTSSIEVEPGEIRPVQAISVDLVQADVDAITGASPQNSTLYALNATLETCVTALQKITHADVTLVRLPVEEVGGQTAAELIAAPAAGYHLEIFEVYLRTIAGTVELHDDLDALVSGELNVGTNDVIHLAMGPDPHYVLATIRALELTNSANAAIKGHIIYAVVAD